MKKENKSAKLKQIKVIVANPPTREQAQVKIRQISEDINKIFSNNVKEI